MRPLARVGALLLLLAGCTEVSDPSSMNPTTETNIALPSAQDIFDGGSGAEGANPHFFFLQPVAETSPSYNGVADDELDPRVVICPIETWDGAGEVCGAPLVTFSMDAEDPDERIELHPGTKYQVVWRTDDHPVTSGQVYRVVVSVLGQALGYADIKAFDNVAYSGHHNTDPNYVAISDNGSLNVSFRIEDGALEAEYCDTENLEDCDVEIFSYDTGGCLQVFENPGQTGEILGSQACVPSEAAELDGVPVEGDYAVILTLEEDAVFQGGVATDWQVPFFPDLRTDPPGISFNGASEGVDVVICQADEGTGAVLEEYHPFLRPFAIYSDGSVVLPEDYTYGVPECHGHEDTHALSRVPSQDDGFGGILGRIKNGLSRVTKAFLPQPLHAFRRLHGGLNTTVYNTRGDTEGPGEGERVAARASIMATPQPEYVVELGAVLDVDPLSSTANVPSTGVVGTETTIQVQALNVQGDPFPFEVPVRFEVSGANSASVDAAWLGAGQYQASYTPATPGTDDILVFVDGDPIPGPFTSEVSPVAASAEFTTFVVSSSEAGSPTTVTVTVLNANEAPFVDGEDYPIDVQVSVTESVSGDPVASVQAEDDDGQGGYDGVYVASYTPEDYGDFDIVVTIDGEPTGDSPQTITTAPWPDDPAQSSISVGDGLVESPTTVSVLVVNTEGGSYDYGDVRPVTVEVTVSGANTESFFAFDPDLDGTYVGSYTPTFPGTDNIGATINGVPVAGTYTSEVAPLSGDLIVVLDIVGGAPADGLPVFLYQGTGPSSILSGTTDSNGEVRFGDIDFGEYTVHLPKRDFDVSFEAMTMAVTHDEAPETVTFSGLTQDLPTGTRVWRVRDGGSGNAFQYIVGGRSWTSAQNQVRDDVLLGVGGHLATITSFEENAFVAEFFTLSPDLCPNETNPKKCKYKGWIGLTDEVQEGVWEWVTGESTTFFSWPDGEEPFDRKGNLDHVEIGFEGFWSIINGASSTNEGYFVEFEVEWPMTPPF